MHGHGGYMMPCMSWLAIASMYHPQISAVGGKKAYAVAAPAMAVIVIPITMQLLEHLGLSRCNISGSGVQ
jgi:hypothetical protein